MSDNFSFKYTFGADDSGFQNVLSRVSGSLDGWGISLDTIYGKSTSLFKSFGVDIDKFAGKIGTTGPALAAGVGLAVAGFQALSKIVAETTEAWRSDEIALVKFNTAIEASGEMGEGASERLKDYARELSYMSGEAQAATQTQIAMLVATGRTEEEVVKITQAAMGLANATGVSVQTAMEQLNATFSGTAGRLTKTTPELLSLTKAELANGEAVDIMLEKYGAFSDSLSGTTDVSIKRHENAISDLKSVMGSWFEMGIKPIRDGLTKMIEYLVEHEEVVYGIMNGIALGLSTILFAFNPILGAIALVGSALLILQQYTGGWKGLWLETQKVALIVVDAIFDAISDLTNGFVFLINGILKGYNAVVGVLGVKPIKLLDPVDISDAIGITAALANVEAQIKANKDENAKLKKQSEETTAAQVEGAERVALNVGKYAADAAEAEIGSLEAQKEAALRYAEERGDSAAMMAYTSKIYDDQILENYKKRIESERQEAIENLAAEEISEENIANINKKYDLEIQAFEQEVINEREELYADFKKKETEAGEKALEEEKKKAEEAAKAEKEKADAIQKTTLDTLSLKLSSIEREKKEALEAARQQGATAEGLSATIQYYDEKILANFLERMEIEKSEAEDTAREKGLDEKAIAEISANYDRQITQFKEGQLDERIDAVKEYAEGVEKAEEDSAENISSNQAPLAKKVKSLWQNVTEGIGAAWNATVDNIAKNASDWSDVIGSVQDALGGATLDALHNVGEAIVTGTADWSAWGNAALSAFAGVLDSIAAQLTALAVVHALSLDFIGAAAAAAGAIAAAVAAGAVRAWVADMEEAEAENRRLAAESVKYATALTEQNAALNESSSLFTKAARATEAYNSVLTKIKSAVASFYTGLQNIGTDIASKLVDNLSKGLAQADFMTSMKDYITNLVIQAAVFTDALSSKIATIGAAIGKGIAGGLSATQLTSFRDELAALWASASSAVSTATSLVSSVFEGYAAGTPYSESGYRLVGEQGPEIIDFPQGARVYNNSETKEILKSDSKVLNFTFNSPREVNQYEAMKAASAEARRLAAEGVF